MTPYTARLPLPDLIVQGRDHTLTCPIYRSGELVAPVSGTVTVLDASGALVVDEQPVSVIDSVATYTVLAAATSGRARSMDWQVRWVLILPDGSTITPRNDAALVKTHLYPVVSDADLHARYPMLDPSTNARISDEETYQGFLDEAWVEINQRLIAKGNRPNLITTPHTLRAVHMHLALALIFDDMSTRQNEASERAAHHREMYREAWAGLQFSYDTDDDGRPDQQARPAEPVWWLG